MCTVMNLFTEEKQIYTCKPFEAVVAAFAQGYYNDYNTWDYDKNYNHLVIEGKEIYSLGDYSVFKDGREF
jgi:hypothetical protein